MSAYLTSPGALKALYSGNALWFTSAFVHFSFRQPLMMRKLSYRKRSTDNAISRFVAGDAWHHDIMAYLGFMNTSLAALSLLRLYALFRPSTRLSTGSVQGDVPLDVMALLVLGVANCSQAWGNFSTAWSGERWIMGRGLDRITVLDALFTVLDFAAAVGKMRGS